MFSVLPGDDYYVEVSRDRISVQNLTTGERRERHPAVRADRRGRRFEFADGAVGVNGFGHPRAFIGDFGPASGALNQAVALVRRSRLIGPGKMLLHVQDAYEGGLSEPEVRAAMDLCFAAGARRARVYDQPGPLSRSGIDRLITGQRGDVEGLF